MRKTFKGWVGKNDKPEDLFTWWNDFDLNGKVYQKLEVNTSISKQKPNQKMWVKADLPPKRCTITVEVED